MDLSKYTEKAQEAVVNSQKLAQRQGNSQVEPEHLLAVLLDQDPGLAVSIIKKTGVALDGLRRKAASLVENFPKVSGSGAGMPGLTRRLGDICLKAEDEAGNFKDEYVSVEHLLLALISDNGPAGKALKEFGLTRDRLMQALQEVRGSQRVTSQNPEATYEALEKYGRDLTKMAGQGKLDPVIGRDEEIRRVIQVLSRRTKNNPVLIGEPGVGKTAIVEGLAGRIIRGDVPEGLKNKRLIALDIGSMLAGAWDSASAREMRHRSRKR